MYSRVLESASIAGREPSVFHRGPFAGLPHAALADVFASGRSQRLDRYVSHVAHGVVGDGHDVLNNGDMATDGEACLILHFVTTKPSYMPCSEDTIPNNTCMYI